MARPQAEPSLYEDVGQTEISQLATEWRERLEWSQEEAEPAPALPKEGPRLTLAARPGPPAAGVLSVEELPVGLPGVRAAAPASPRRPSQPIPISQPPALLPASRVSAQLPVVAPSRRSAQLPVMSPPSRVSSQLSILAPPPRSSDPSLPGAAVAAKLASPEAAAASAPEPRGRKNQLLALLTVATLSVAVHAVLLARGSWPWRPVAGTVGAAPAAAPATPSAPATGAALLATGPCLRESSQTIASDERDELLLRAVQAFENGKQDQAHNLFLRYVHEACDAATLEAVSILSREREPASGDKGGAR